MSHIILPPEFILPPYHFALYHFAPWELFNDLHFLPIPCIFFSPSIHFSPGLIFPPGFILHKYHLPPPPPPPLFCPSGNCLWFTLFTHVPYHFAPYHFAPWESFNDLHFLPILCFIFIRPTCRDVLWYGVGVCLSICLSVCLSVRLSTKLVNTIQTEPFQLGLSNLVHSVYYLWQEDEPYMNYTLLLLNLVNTIQTEPFQLGLSNLVHILLTTRGRTLLIFKVMGQRSSITR